MREREKAEEVRRYELLEVFCRIVSERLADKNASVVDKEINAAKPLYGCLDDPHSRFLMGDIPFHKDKLLGCYKCSRSGNGASMRTGLIMRSIQGISQKMLTQTLRDLERSGVVERRSYPEVPPRVEYSLTPLGTTLSVLVFQFEQWVVNNYEQVIEAQTLFDTLHSEDSDALE